MYFFRLYRATLLGTFALAVFLFFFQTPFRAPSESLVVVEEGMPLGLIASTLKDSHVVPSSLALRLAVMLSGGAEDIKAGPYRFDYRESVVHVARRLVAGDYGIEPTRVVFPEGLPAHDMGPLLEEIIGAREAARFAARAGRYEGFLFPDTYFILPTAKAGELISLFTDTFQERTAELREQVASSTRAWNDVVIMASIVEEEARTREDKRIVAGILWKRLDDGMRLQVDAPFAYLLGKTSEEITREDLASDSPYNTYRLEGLPPAPISNPGLVTLEATINPIETDYWFYLSDSAGTIHYAVTYDEHLNNKARYID